MICLKGSADHAVGPNVHTEGKAQKNGLNDYHLMSLNPHLSK